MPDGSDSYTVEVEGMSCAACAVRIDRALARGVGGGSASLATHSVRVPAAVAAAQLSRTLEEAGYPAREAVLTLAVEGMTCASCTGRVERRLAALPGVLEARANLADGTVRLRLLAGAQDAAAAAAALAPMGYVARPLDPDAPATDRMAEEAAKARRRFLIAAVLTLPLFVAEMGGHVVPAFHHWLHGLVPTRVLWAVQAVLAGLVLAGPGRGFFRHGIPGLLRGAPDMNALVAIGTGSAYALSLVATVAPQVLPEGARAVWFEAAAVIVTLILLGRWLEARARGQAGAAIRALMRLAPPVARVERDGRVEEVALALVRPGDRVHLPPGARVPVDGTVLAGESHLDESMLTGEPMPVARGPGDRVAAGTLNGLGALVVRAERVGADTALARIARLVEGAQAARLPVQDLVDRVAARFVPAVLAAATLTVAAWLALAPAPALGPALTAGIAVLVVACPCAMGLAVPVSIMAAMGRAAQLGVIFRRGEALQRLAGARAVAFDKTGTLTEGRPALTDIRTAPGLAEAEALRLAAAAEAGSEHPLGRALVAAAQAQGLTLPPAQDFRAEPGIGVRARVEGVAVAVGGPRLLARDGAEPGALGPEAARLAAAGRTAFYLLREGQVAAVFGLSDPVRPGSAAAVRALAATGVAVAMVTGDAAPTAQAVAAGLGIGRVTAGASPEGKVAALAALRAEAGPVVFVGDGINDAPVLAAADAGLAMGGGTDIAIAAADAVIPRGDPRAVADAIALARATMANIRLNLIFAFGYNAALIPVAAGALWPAFGIQISPMLAAAAMAASSLCVVGNALRLTRFRPPRA